MQGIVTSETKELKMSRKDKEYPGMTIRTRASRTMQQEYTTEDEDEGQGTPYEDFSSEELGAAAGSSHGWPPQDYDIHEDPKAQAKFTNLQNQIRAL